MDSSNNGRLIIQEIQQVIKSNGDVDSKDPEKNITHSTHKYKIIMYIIPSTC